VASGTSDSFEAAAPTPHHDQAAGASRVALSALSAANAVHVMIMQQLMLSPRGPITTSRSNDVETPTLRSLSETSRAERKLASSTVRCKLIAKSQAFEVEDHVYVHVCTGTHPRMYSRALRIRPFKRRNFRSQDRSARARERRCIRVLAAACRYQGLMSKHSELQQLTC